MICQKHYKNNYQKTVLGYIIHVHFLFLIPSFFSAPINIKDSYKDKKKNYYKNLFPKFKLPCI